MPKPTKAERLLAKAAKAQTAYWDALHDLEAELGFDIDDPGELGGKTVIDLMDEYGDEDGDEDDD